MRSQRIVTTRELATAMFFLCFLIGMGMLIGGWKNHNDAALLKNEGLEVVGTITAKSIDTYRNSTTCYLKYHFQTSRGDANGEDRIREEDYQRIEIGDKIKVQYDRSNPALSRTSLSDIHDISAFLYSIGAIMEAVCVLFGMRAWFWR